MTRIGIIGFGLMGRTHLNAYLNDPRAKIHAIADPMASSLDLDSVESNFGSDKSSFDIESVRHLKRAADVFADPEVEAVSICTPTRTHVDLTIQALRAGKHVLVEKPLGLRSADAYRAVREADAHSNLIAMPAMCIRFWPAWRWLHDAIEDRRFGGVQSAVFTRTGPMPTWSDFYAKSTESGGAILDLHIHDADFIRYCFGEPDTVVATGRSIASGGIDHLIAHFHYANGPAIVTAEGGWLATPDAPFTMRYLVHFDEAVARFEFGGNDELTVTADGATGTVALPTETGYDGEVRAFLDAIESGTQCSVVTMMDAVKSIELIEAERASIASSEPVSPGSDGTE